MIPDDALAEAIELHKTGHFGKAERVYRKIIDRNPKDANALNLLGSLALQTNRPGVACDFIQRAIAANPNVADFHNNLGVALLAEKRHDDAAAAFRRAVELNPNYAEGYFNLGLSLTQLDRLDEAADAYRKSIACNPQTPAPQQNLARILPRVAAGFMKSNRQDDAVAALKEAALLTPENPDAHYALGNTLRTLGRLPESAEALGRALEINPNHVDALNVAAIVYANLGRMRDALDASTKVAKLSPQSPGAYMNLGTILREMGYIEEAVQAYRAAIQLLPTFAEAHSNLASALSRIGQNDEAISIYRQAMRLKPNDSHLQSNLIFTLCFHPGYDAAAILAEVRQWDQRHGQPVRKFIQPHRNVPDHNRRLKIGYVSSDFRGHVVGWNLLPYLRHHDRGQFEIFCYNSAVHKQDEMTDKIRAEANQWRDVTAMNDQRVADLIRADEIDILVDLSLHTANNRLVVFAMEPAPVQVTYLGYCSTSGVEAMHYRLSDPHLDPPEQDLACYTEQTIRLPKSYWSYEPGGIAPEVADPPSQINGFVTFGCLNQSVKISTATLELWRQILERVPDSRLLMLATTSKHQETLKQKLGADRVEFIPRQPWEDYMRTYNRIDIALDPFPYNGGITTCDTLFMGVPVITLSGRTSMGRAGRSILSNVGLSDLVARTPDDYIQIAANLAADRSRLVELRRTLRDRMKSSPLMNPQQFARDIESAFRQMWQAWCAKQSAAPQSHVSQPERA